MVHLTKRLPSEIDMQLNTKEQAALRAIIRAVQSEDYCPPNLPIKKLVGGGLVRYEHFILAGPEHQGCAVLTILFGKSLSKSTKRAPWISKDQRPAKVLDARSPQEIRALGLIAPADMDSQQRNKVTLGKDFPWSTDSEG